MVCGAVDNRVVFVSLWLVAEVGVRAATQPCGPRWSPAWWTARAALGHDGLRRLHAHTTGSGCPHMSVFNQFYLQ